MNKILIIDQAGEQTASTVSFLTDCGYEVIKAENVFLAAAILNKTKFDLILCSQDLFLEEQSPLQDIILEDNRHSKIILLQKTGEKSPDVPENNRIIGTIQKPVDQEKLLEVISSKVSNSGFTGMVNDIALTDYLQLLAMNKATKAISVEGETGNGLLVLHKGVLVYAAFGEFYGDLAFHALLSLQNGKIIDKKLKRVPHKNISKSLPQLLLEATANSDERSIDDNTSRGNFLLDETHTSEPSHTVHVITPEHGQGKRGRAPLFAGLTFLVLIGLLGGVALKFFSPLENNEKHVISRQNRIELPVASAITPAPPLSTSIPASQPPEAPDQTASHDSAPKILLRLHGSNTIGSKLAVNLATDYLVQKLNGKDITILKGAEPVEKIIVGQTDQGLIGIEIHAHGSSTGFKDLKAGTCDIGMASRKIKDTEVTALADLGNMTVSSSEHIVALDGIAVIVNKRNPIRSLSIDKIAAIFSGKVTDWKEVSDGKLEGPINVYARDDKSGTYDTFKGIVLKKSPLTATASRFESNGDLSDTVARDRLGIGFTGLPYIRQAKALSVSDQGTAPVYPNFFTVATEDYLLARRLYLYLPQNNDNPVAADFIDYCLTASGQMVVSDTGFVDLAIRSFVAGIDVESMVIQNRVVFQHYVEETKNKKRLSLNFRFHPNSTELDNRALKDLDRMVEFLKAQPIESVTLIGFADSKGDYQYNTDLSMERSKVVRRELKSRGIPISSTISASEEMPVSSNMTNRGREKNRRVEVWVRLNKV